MHPHRRAGLKLKVVVGTASMRQGHARAGDDSQRSREQCLKDRCQSAWRGGAEIVPTPAAPRIRTWRKAETERDARDPPCGVYPIDGTVLHGMGAPSARRLAQ